MYVYVGLGFAGLVSFKLSGNLNWSATYITNLTNVIIMANLSSYLGLKLQADILYTGTYTGLQLFSIQNLT